MKDSLNNDTKNAKLKKTTTECFRTYINSKIQSYRISTDYTTWMVSTKPFYG